ncbi:pyridoxamine 5'-phosphate oxidase family protein [Emcibacter nanhaiensis]|uniref:Pyridoxamine 5'-phosphate oxidase family protein n=1 Tax=Emcibacter nanhaiensis TaxID=1505037 RepID=A0A501PCS1_9PROT|nr:pyridoxamine 5'-phosphate oxidase family protein [Emcibacter nanhaiensis]TPD57822.1 pyridoxamine 5'-phosphate oxidase family protein [Emcibacter nanhaiensis]
MARGYDLESRPANRHRRGHLGKDDEWIRDFISRAPLGYFASRWDDQPFIHPMTYVYDPERHCIYAHGSVVGRRRANTERHDKMAFCATEMGRLLPSNRALHFSSQYRSVMAFGRIRHVEDRAEMEHGLYSLIDKYFSPLALNENYSPIVQDDIDRVTVFALDIESWSGKENWKAMTSQNDGFPPLAEAWHKDEAFPMSFGRMAPSEDR